MCWIWWSRREVVRRALVGEFRSAFYPSSVIRAKKVDDGTVLSGAGTVFFSGGEIDNGSGTVSHIFGTLVMAPAGASGSGTLVKIAFQAVAAGTPQIAISNITLLDSNLNPIVIDDTPDQVTTNVTVTTAEVQTPQIDPSMPLL